MPRLLTLTTDFGTRDAYVAAMKGVMCSISPALRMVDVTHEVTPQDVMEAAFVLREAVPYFPEDTVHLVVVDPGVGTARRPLALRSGGHWFVGPDNGLFPLILDEASPDAAVVLDEPRFWRTPEPSTTFHGRDIFAPAAAHLSAGAPLDTLGSPAGPLEPLHWALPITEAEGIQGWVVHVDRFGNCITNITRAAFKPHGTDHPLKCFVGTTVLEAVQPTYGAAPASEPLLLFGSSDHLEVAVNGGNAAELLDIRKGTPVDIVFPDER